MKKMKKTLKKLIGILTLSTILCTTTVFASEPLNLNIFGKTVVGTDAAPYLEDNRTMVPMRLISENLGFDVKWDGNTKAFSVEGVEVVDKESVLIVGKMNQSQVSVTRGGTTTKKNIDDSPKVVVTMKNNRLYVPLRFFSESFGLVVKYDAANRTVFIYYPGNEPKPSADVVWNGNVKDFVTALKEKTNMTLSKDGLQAKSENGNILAGKPYNSTCDVEIVSRGWLFDKNFYPTEIKKEMQTQTALVKTVLEMYTSDKTAYSKANATLQAGKARDESNPIVLSDGTKLTVTGENGLIKFRLYSK